MSSSSIASNMHVRSSGVGISVNDRTRVRGDCSMKNEQKSIAACSEHIYQQGLFWIRVDNTTFTPIAPYFQEPLIAGIKRRLRVVILLVFSRFRCRPVDDREMYSGAIACLPTYLGRPEESRSDLYSRRASNFPDDKSL